MSTPTLKEARLRGWRGLAAAAFAVGVTALPVVALAAPATARDAIPAATGPNMWSATGTLAVVRNGETATLLPTGSVLIAGGNTRTAELYYPPSRLFTRTGSMSVSRIDATATLLQSGDVLVVGGRGIQGHQLSSAELYDPTSGTWSRTGSMHTARSGQTATLLPDGDVLVAGGGCNPGRLCDSGSFLQNLAGSELYHPDSGTWTRAGLMSIGRQDATAVLLQDGDVLVAGGFVSCDDDFCVDTRKVDLYDPATGDWSSARPMPAAGEQQSSVVLQNGNVFVTGGMRVGSGLLLHSAILYSATTGRWRSEPPTLGNQLGQSTALLPNGWVLLAGTGEGRSEVFEPDIGQWVKTGTMHFSSPRETITTLADGSILVIGTNQQTGETFQPGAGPLVRFDPTSLSFPTQRAGNTSPPLNVTVSNLGSADLHVSAVQVTGADASDFGTSGNCAGADLQPRGVCTLTVAFSPTQSGDRSASVVLVDDAPGGRQSVPVHGFGRGPDTWTPTGSMSTHRTLAGAVRLQNGDVLVFGGEEHPTGEVGTAELYDPTTGTFSSTGDMTTERAYVTGTLLPDGRVLVAGGYGTSGPLSTAEVYSPASGTWQSVSPMHGKVYAGTQTLLPSGKVLVTGFGFGDAAEIYDPATDTWTDTGAPVGDGFFGTATLLPSGQVLVAGATDGTNAAGLYDPATNAWTKAASPLVARQAPQAALLPDGDVLLAGGEPSGGGPAYASSEIYDPSTNTWTMTSTSMSDPRYGFNLTALSSGDLIASGGCTGDCPNSDRLTSTDRFDVTTGDWHPVSPMVRGTVFGTATLLTDGEILEAGGGPYCCGAYASAELYDAAQVTASPDHGPVGTSVEIRGRGYFAHEPVHLTFDGTPIGHARTGIEGGFVAMVTVPGGQVGAHVIAAEGSNSQATSTVVFTITGAG